MNLDALQLTIIEESHQSVMVKDYRFDFLYNSLINRWFVSFYYKDTLVFAGVKITPNKDLVESYGFDFEFVVLYDGEIGIDELVEAKVLYIPKEQK